MDEPLSPTSFMQLPSNTTRIVSKKQQLPPLRLSLAQRANELSHLGKKMLEESRTLFLHKKSHQLLTSEELTGFWNVIEKNSSKGTTLNYQDFLNVGNMAPANKLKGAFTAKTFARLSRGKLTISSDDLVSFIARKEWYLQAKITLSLYDQSGAGYLTEPDVDSYVQDMIPTLIQLEDMESSFHPFYSCIATRRFFFWLDPHKMGRIKITDILESGIFDQLCELKSLDLDERQLDKNPFSLTTALRIYNSYIALDDDNNGMLNREELKRFGDTRQTFTSAFVDRFFEENVTYDNEIDFKCYVDLVLASNNRKDPQSVLYFYRMLDMKKQGFLDEFTIYYFFKEMINLMKDNNTDIISYEDVRNEIYDIVKPKQLGKITSADLINCGQGDVVITMLTDFTGFYEYESKDGGDFNDTEIEEIHLEAKQQQQQ